MERINMVKMCHEEVSPGLQYNNAFNFRKWKRRCFNEMRVKIDVDTYNFKGFYYSK